MSAPTNATDDLIYVHAPISTFHRFRDLPVEVRILIWKIFYLTPRVFIAELERWSPPGRLHLSDHDYAHLGLDTDNLDRFMIWTFKYANEARWLYYRSIDNEIDRLSRSVAQSLRPPFWVPAWHKRLVGNRYLYTTLPPEKNPKTPMPEIHHINWNVDLICLSEEDVQGISPTLSSWWKLVQHLAISPAIEDFPYLKFHITTENTFLWSNKSVFRGLKSLRRLHPTRAGPSTLSEGAHFQTRYLLRDSPHTPPEWRKMDYNRAFWPPDNMDIPPQPSWSKFLRRLQSHPDQIEGISSRELSKISADDEAAGAREFFRGMVQMM
ncbi:hypothetical protein CKAH01_16862 [Colletotrichum kahawae]|uniref:Uncharacterized protein n=1 Tax=Colletotrichum kahawae TaxID=34407 RepID=A0AAD9YBP2_COLKA|nr:hypothetical protein CKAH01_16862 [Colletotrichum kahawae]